MTRNSKAFDAESPTGDKYADARLVDRNSNEITVKDEGSFTESVSFQKFNAGWGTVSGGTATFEMEFKNLGLLYLKTIDGKSAQVSIIVDGKEVKPIAAISPEAGEIMLRLMNCMFLMKRPSIQLQ